MMKDELKFFKKNDKDQAAKNNKDDQPRLTRLYGSLFLEDDFKFGLEICLYVLRGLNLNHYVKLERDEGPDRIYNFALKYDIK